MNLAIIENHDLQRLKEERAWLLKQIERKQSQLNSLVSAIYATNREFHQRTYAMATRIARLEIEIMAILDKTLRDRNLKKKDRKKIDKIYSIFKHVEPSDRPKPEKQTNSENCQKNWSENNFQNNSKENKNKNLKSLYLKLAWKFHPDKKNGDAALMREIITAYEQGDLLRLMKIEANSQVTSDDRYESEIEAERLKAENAALKNRYKIIKARLREIQLTEDGKSLKKYRALVKKKKDPFAKHFAIPFARIKMLEISRSLAVRFQKGEIKLDDFIDRCQKANFSYLLACT